MKKTGIVLSLVMTMVGVGCGSSSSSGGGSGSSAPDFVALETTLTQPSGTFGQGQEGAVQDGFAAQNEAASNGALGGSSGGATTKSAHGLFIQAMEPLATNGNDTCPGLQQGGQGSCACPNGGSLDYNVPAGGMQQQQQNSNGSIDETVSIVAHACGTPEGQTIDGSLYYKIKSPPPEIIYSIHLVITGNKAGKYDVDFMYKDGMMTFAVDVADGKVLVSAKGGWDKTTKTGTLVIKDKNEIWTCTLNNGKGTCTSDKGTQRQVGG